LAGSENDLGFKPALYFEVLDPTEIAPTQDGLDGLVDIVGRHGEIQAI
jgi:hypothetical protein